MTDSRSRFEAWLPPAMNFCEQTCAWMAWQAAEAETARRCAEIVEGSKLNGIRSVLVNDIKAEFPEAWK